MMRITLNQNEIELALKNYVNKLLSVQDGINMTIDIKATRGEGGMTAEIELSESVKTLSDKIPASPINRATQLGQAPVATSAAAPVQVTQPATSPSRLVQRFAATQVSVESATAAADTDNVTVTANTDGPAAQDPPTGPSSGGSVEQAASVEIVKKPAVGLFANLKKPVNTPTPE